MIAFKEKITEKIVNYGLSFTTVVILPLNIIIFFALEQSSLQILRYLPIIFSVVTFLLFVFRNKLNSQLKIRIFSSILFSAGFFALLLGLLDMASLWFILSIIFVLFDKTKQLPLFTFAFALLLIISTGFLLYLKNTAIPIDYGFENCQFACVAIRIIDFLIIGFLVFKILGIFINTITLYIDELLEKSKVLEQLKITERNEAAQKIKNESLRHDIEKREYEILLKRKELSDAFSKIIRFKSLLDEIDKHIENNNIKEAISIIKINQTDNYSLENFKIQFNELFPDFSIKLQDYYPKLTDAEVNICILITAGLKSSEMSTLIHVTEASVGKYRNRIRKKLGINSKENIADFLSRKLKV